MKLALFTVGKPSASFAAAGLKHYQARLKAHGGCELCYVKAAPAGPKADPAKVMAQEAKRLLARLDKRDVLWALDRKGQPWTSVQWARELQKTRLIAPPRLVLLIGGHLGLDQTVRQRAQKLISLGPPTLPHELAAVTALEQLFRAHSILAGSPYHR